MCQVDLIVALLTRHINSNSLLVYKVCVRDGPNFVQQRIVDEAMV